MDIPSSHEGVVKEIKVNVGDQVAKDSILLMVEATANAAEEPIKPGPAEEETPKTEAPAVAPTPVTPVGDNDVESQVVVLGSGPGGYTAAFRAAEQLFAQLT